MIKTIIDNYFQNDDQKNGLMLLSLPTGSGKTHNVINSIYDRIPSLAQHQKVFFITNLKKNLDLEKLEGCYRAAGRGQDYQNEVLQIKSNADYIQKILEIQIPEQFKKESYRKLVKIINDLKRTEGYIKKSQDPQVGHIFRDSKDKILDDIRLKLEPEFRKFIASELKKHFKTPDQKLDAIKNNSNYQWIGELYPSVYTKERKVFFLSMKKFLSQHATLIEPSYHFLSHPITESAVIVLDEFDSTKDTVSNHYIEQALNFRGEILSTFKQIRSGLNNEQISKKIITSNELIKGQLEALKKESNRIYDEFLLDLSYKTNERDIDRNRNFLFHSDTFISILSKSKDYIRTTPNIADGNNMLISFESPDKYNENANYQIDVNLYSLLRQVNNFIRRFRRTVFLWAQKLVSDTKNASNQGGGEPQIEKIISTIYYDFSLTEDVVHFLMKDIEGRYTSRKKEKQPLRDTSFYTNGFHYYEFIDDEEHSTTTNFGYTGLNDTPEKWLLKISMRAKVLGISATAQIESVLCNYDIPFLKDQLGSNFLLLENSEQKKLEANFKKEMEVYHNGRVTVRVNVIDEAVIRLQQSITDQFMDLLEDIDEAESESIKLSHLLSNLSNTENREYISHRYLNLFRVLKYFLRNSDMESLLVLNMPLPKMDHPAFDETYIRKFFEQIILHHSADGQLTNAELVILNSQDFDSKKDELLQKLGKGSKVAVLSSYLTIGAGQNLQYPVPESNSCFSIQPNKQTDKRNQTKDFDGLYLGDITYNVLSSSQLFKNQAAGSEKELLKYLFQIESLSENSEISPAKKREFVKEVFTKYSNGSTGKVYTDMSLYNLKSTRLALTKTVIQSVGRICRTFNKKSNIHIYTTKSVLEKLDDTSINHKLLNPEMDALFLEQAAQHMKTPVQQPEQEWKASKISSRGKQAIMEILAGDWDTEKMTLWNDLRNLVLSNPTACAEIVDVNPLMKQLYIAGDVPLNKYFFAQRNDFSEVRISLKSSSLAQFKYSLSEPEQKYNYISEVSETEARLPQLLEFPGMSQFFEKNGWATQFEEQLYILSPVLFHNIYKGSLGEVAGKFILEQSAIALKPITDPDKFEFFDYEVTDSPDVYIDFKHWKETFTANHGQMIQTISKKMEKIGAKKVFIINLLGEGNYTIHENEGIIEIPYLWHKENGLNHKAIQLLGGK